MAESVYKIIELVGTSPESWEKAAKAAVDRAAKSLRDLRVAEVVEQDLQLKDGKVEAYRAKVEAYEIPYLQQKNNAARLDADIMRNDPVDRPISKNPTPDRPDLNSPSTTVPPRP